MPHSPNPCQHMPRVAVEVPVATPHAFTPTPCHSVSLPAMLPWVRGCLCIAGHRYHSMRSEPPSLLPLVPTKQKITLYINTASPFSTFAASPIYPCVLVAHAWHTRLDVCVDACSCSGIGRGPREAWVSGTQRRTLTSGQAGLVGLQRRRCLPFRPFNHCPRSTTTPRHARPPATGCLHRRSQMRTKAPYYM